MKIKYRNSRKSIFSKIGNLFVRIYFKYRQILKDSSCIMQKTTFSLLLFLFISFSTIGQSRATYNITFNSIWNATDHTSLPGSAHWSKLVGATHKTSNTFFQIGGIASTGIKNIAESGSNTVFNTEVNAQITANEADQYIYGLSLGSGDIVINGLEVDEKFPLVTLVSMIAPSPDWFIAINSYNLLDTNEDWKTSVILDVFGYDAGTDSGSNYTSSNIITSPFEPISMINTVPINGNKMGTITITLQSVLSVETINPLSTISVYPNPSTGNFKLSNPNSVELKSILVYTILGKKVASRKASSDENYDFSYLENGIYVLKITSKDNNIKTQKLLIK